MRELAEPPGSVVLRHRPQLLQDDRRLFGQVSPEERAQRLGQLSAIGLGEQGWGHDQLEEGASSHGARPEARPQADEDDVGGQAGGLLSPRERAEEGEALHASRRAQGDLLGDEAAHRVPDEVEPFNLLGVHDGQRVERHRLDGEWIRAERASAQAPVVERDRRVAVAEAVALRAPPVADHAHPLDEEGRGTAACSSIAENGGSGLQPARRLRHGDAVLHRAGPSLSTD